MTIATTIAAIQTVNGGITGIRSAPVTIPGALNTSDLPIALVIVGPGEPTRISDFSIHRRTYYVRVFVKPVAQGVKPDEGYREAYILLQRFVEAYLADITFSGAFQHIGRGAWYDPPTLEDNGVRGDMQYVEGGTAYHGFEIVLSVKEQII